MSIFEQATRQHLRFDSPRGELTTEDLWDLPLTSARGPSLDSIAVAASGQLEAAGQQVVSFVTASDNTGKRALLQLKFDVVKHILDIRMKERDDKAAAADRREKKQRILELIAKKDDQELEGKSKEELKALAESL